ncbi:MAG TPA: ATP-binding protein [Ignavibacteriales bacterium]|nr:ATP-binding protein [Ignavibacteriales bacterium]
METYHLEINSDPNKLPLVEEFLEEITSGANVDKTQMNNLLLAVNEAISNAMIHGNKASVDKKVKLKVEIGSGSLKVFIQDEGKGFKPDEVPDPTQPENIFRDSGRGLYIMKSCMDEVSYNFTPEGTELVLSMKLNN